MSDSSSESVSEEIQEATETVGLGLLPKKSIFLYEKEYSSFKEWCSTNGVNKISEEVVLSYFSDRAKVLKSSSLWSRYSMLKSTLSIKEGIDIRHYLKLKAFLKTKSSEYRAKTSKVFTRQQINSFLIEAPDEKYLLMKVAMIMGLSGACGRDELTNLTVNNVEDRGSLFVVKILDTKTYIHRTFTISHKEDNGANPVVICRKYTTLRPPHVEHKRFFLQYKSGKCTVQAVGINQIAKIPRLIATYLKLPNPEMYTGRSFRKSSASLLGVVGAGANILRLKCHGVSKSSRVSEGYFEEYIEEKDVRNDVKIESKICQRSESMFPICEIEHIDIKHEIQPVPDLSSEFVSEGVNYIESHNVLHKENQDTENDCKIVQEIDVNNYSVNNYSDQDPFKCQNSSNNENTNMSIAVEDSQSGMSQSMPGKERQELRESNSYGQDLLEKCLKLLDRPTDNHQIFGNYVAAELRNYPDNGYFQNKLKLLIQKAIVSVAEEKEAGGSSHKQF